MGANRLTLIRELSTYHSLDGRFTNIHVVNCNPLTGDRQTDGGALSVVFKADDSVSGRPVAIKFFDPDYVGAQAAYRLDLFHRECDLLSRLAGKRRCIQLIEPIKQLDITVTDPATRLSLTKDTYYFAVEWLDEDINDFFLCNQAHTASEKLKVFRGAILAVFALHNEGIYHRDLKRDNLRVAIRDESREIVTIDLGTAAAHDSVSLGLTSDYLKPIGAPAFAPLEAMCGLSGIRSLGIYGDLYALGCMLYDLFNVDLFIVKQFQDNGFKQCQSTCYATMYPHHSLGSSDCTLMTEWDAVIGRTKRQVQIPAIDDHGSSVPASISDLLNKLLRSLTAVDYRDRETDTNKILRIIDTASKLLNNTAAEKRAIDRKRDIRRRKEAKRLLKQQLMQSFRVSH